MNKTKKIYATLLSLLYVSTTSATNISAIQQPQSTNRLNQKISNLDFTKPTKDLRALINKNVNTKNPLDEETFQEVQGKIVFYKESDQKTKNSLEKNNALKNIILPLTDRQFEERENLQYRIQNEIQRREEKEEQDDPNIKIESSEAEQRITKEVLTISQHTKEIIERVKRTYNTDLQAQGASFQKTIYPALYSLMDNLPVYRNISEQDRLKKKYRGFIDKLYQAQEEDENYDNGVTEHEALTTLLLLLEKLN